MLNFLLKSCLLIFLISSSVSIMAQVAQKTPITAQSASTDQKITEIYGTQFFNNKPELHQQFVRLLEERVEYKHEPISTDEKYPTVTQAGLNNKYNSNLTGQINSFSPNTFNPLRYRLNFFDKKKNVYRIDGTDYLLVINPQ